ncbi:hypothetical protein OBP_156 [Pseudomonas phage OBP]|uniref:hypothetical protein n=1 Tax=Pseudomonas phage OBP TaxID=1124849 RepID=UPI000240D571|nr:hypothetical protein OBP_156 [Pseudomonas phage OBP]AEV89593.1 hypothetical protein OBP_156 [Pseudomonas phage OBP]
MEKHYDLQRRGNDGWILNRGDHQIQIFRLREEIQIGPHFKKELCGVAFRYQDSSKNDPQESITLSLKTIDPEHDNTDHSLIYMTRKILEQVHLGTFGQECSRLNERTEFLEYILKFLGEDPNVYIDRPIRIPIDTPIGKQWLVNLEDERYYATRSYSPSDDLYTTTIHLTNTKFQIGSGKYKNQSMTFMSKTAVPLDINAVVLVFK